MAKGPTKLPKHHYIPVLYLSQWADGNGRLYEFSRPNGRSEVSVRPTGPKGTGYDRGLYRLTGVPEDVSEAVERKFMAQVDILTEVRTTPLLRGHVHFWLGRVSLRCGVNLALRRQRSHVRIVSGAPVLPHFSARYARSNQESHSVLFE
jgi:hypothetical protein